MTNKYNICPYCGGKLIKEYFGSYGDAYYLKADGEAGKKRIKRYIYEYGGEDDTMIYCSECGKIKWT